MTDASGQFTPVECSGLERCPDCNELPILEVSGSWLIFRCKECGGGEWSIDASIAAAIWNHECEITNYVGAEE